MHTSFEHFKNSISESKAKPALTSKDMRDFLLNYLEDNKYSENEKLLKRDLADFVKVTKAAHKLSKEDTEKLKAYAESKLAKEKVDKKKKAVKENFQSSMSLGDNFNDIMSDLNMMNDLFENEYLNGQLDIAEGYTIDDIMDHLMNEFGMDDQDEFYTILAKTKKAIIAYDSPVNSNESVRHGVFPYFTVKIDTMTATFSEVDNDLAQEAVLEGNDDPNIITFCSSWSRGQCESVANEVISRLKNGEAKQTILDSLFEEWY